MIGSRNIIVFCSALTAYLLFSLVAAGKERGGSFNATGKFSCAIRRAMDDYALRGTGVRKPSIKASPAVSGGKSNSGKFSERIKETLRKFVDKKSYNKRSVGGKPVRGANKIQRNIVRRVNRRWGFVLVETDGCTLAVNDKLLFYHAGKVTGLGKVGKTNGNIATVDIVEEYRTINVNDKWSKDK